MNFTELKRVLPSMLNSGVSYELVSAPGRGKSEFIEQLIKQLSARDGEPWGLSTLFLATMTPPDLIGYLFKGERTYEGKTVTITDPTLPMWMMSSEGLPLWHYKRGILFLDEFGQAQTDVKAAAAELMRVGQVGTWRIPPGWTVIAASNRMSDRSAVTKSLDQVINRRLEVIITDDLQSWENWAFESGIDPLFISFANQYPNVVFSEGVPEKQGPWCTPRSLVMLSRVLDTLRDDKGRLPVDKLAVELAGGMIGQAGAAQLFAHIRLGHEMPDYADIVKDPMKCKVADKPDANILITYNLAARVSVEDIDPVVKYMMRLPKEFAVTFAKAACNRVPALIHSKAIEDWAQKNSTLMVAVFNIK